MAYLDINPNYDIKNELDWDSICTGCSAKKWIKGLCGREEINGNEVSYKKYLEFVTS